jgi:hypothetical protein
MLRGPSRYESGQYKINMDSVIYYYLFTAIGFAPGGSGPYTTQLQQNTYNKNKYTP